MRATTAILEGLKIGEMVSLAYLDDLTDAEMLQRPCAGANHINWQIGHLLKSEHDMIGTIVPGSMSPLPAGFSERYGNEHANCDDPKQLCSKAELMAIYQQVRPATAKALAGLGDADLDKASPERFQAYAPTFASLFSMQGSHWLMHAGQWAVVRRQLGRKPIF